MKKNRYYFDTYEGNNFPLSLYGLAVDYAKKYKTTTRVVLGIRKEIFWKMFLVAFGPIILVVPLIKELPVLFISFIIAGSLITSQFIVPELVVRKYIKAGILKPPKRK